MKIDLKQSHDSNQVCPSPPSVGEDYYPTTYISNTNGDLSGVDIDSDVKLEGRVKGITKNQRNGKTSYSLEIEITSLEADGASKKPKKKASDENFDEIEKGLSETESEKKKTEDENDE